MNASDLRTAMAAIAAKMKQERQYLIELDQRNGDGDLGISMDEGFNAASRAMNESAETDLGKLLICASKAFNEAAPSSLGTIMSLQMMGMARTLKGHASADAALLGEALKAGVEKVMDKAVDFYESRFLSVQLPGGIELMCRDIIAIKSEHVYSTIVLADGELSIRRSLKEWETLLPEKDFLRLNEKWIIHYAYVDKIKDD